MAQQRLVLLRCVIQGLNMLPGNNQQMGRCLRIDVADYHATIVLMNIVRRDVTRGDFAEQTASFTHFVLFLN